MKMNGESKKWGKIFLAILAAIAVVGVTFLPFLGFLFQN
jgi:hypothetical protein